VAPKSGECRGRSMNASRDSIFLCVGRGAPSESGGRRCLCELKKPNPGESRPILGTLNTKNTNTKHSPSRDEVGMVSLPLVQGSLPIEC
jgi:hypothetical protein